MLNKKPMLEAEIQKQIIKYLRLKQYLVIRHNPFRPNADGVFFKLSDIDKGIPDLICCIDGKFVSFEIKANRGKQSEHQKIQEKLIKKNGGEYYLVYSLDDVISILNRRSIF